MKNKDIWQTAEDLVRSEWKKYDDKDVRLKYWELMRNKREWLEKYQETGRRTALDMNSKNQHVSLDQEKRDYAIKMERRKTFTPAKLPEKVYMNHNMKWYLKTEVTDELLKKEEDWAITWLDYLQDNK